jgi:hypothetical protein
LQLDPIISNKVDARIKWGLLSFGRTNPIRSSRWLRWPHSPVGQPVTLWRNARQDSGAPPKFGEQIEEVLAEFGFACANELTGYLRRP